MTYQPSSAKANGGYTPGKLIAAGSTNGTTIKASAGTLGFLTASNVSASARYVKIYNKASNPTVGTDTPVFTFLVPANTSGTNLGLPTYGAAFATGIALAITALAADNDATAITAGDVIVNYGYA